MRHYFIHDETLESKPFFFKINLFNEPFTFKSDQGVFSKNELDYGSKTLLKTIKIGNHQKVLDIGCGIGIMGIILKRLNPKITLLMSDVHKRAVELAKENIKLNQVDAHVVESNLFEAIDETFDLILSNPPIRAGKKVIYALYQEAHTHLNDGGSLWLVVRKNQGAKSTVHYLKTLFKEVFIKEKDKGYYVIYATK